LTWSGSGKIARVEVSTDGGKTWADAELQTPVLSKSTTQFRYPRRWDGQTSTLQSRCTDESGYLQPTHEEFLASYGRHIGYHYHAIKSWYVKPSGEVKHV
jgi:sulfane dehydrogenase subunit SoxC